jgi:hypothetical protein
MYVYYQHFDTDEWAFEQDGRTCLYRAVCSGNLSIVKSLVEKAGKELLALETLAVRISITSSIVAYILVIYSYIYILYLMSLPYHLMFCHDLQGHDAPRLRENNLYYTL